MEEQKVDNDSRLPAAECVYVRLDHVTSRWTVGSPRRQQRAAKRHRGHWVSGPSALMTSDLRLQDLSVRLFLSLCLSIVGLTSLTSIRTTSMSRWNTGHWVSGPLVLVIDRRRLHRLQSGQWTTVGSYLLLQRLQSTRLRTAKRCNGHRVSGPSALMRSDLRLQDLSTCLSLSLCLSIAGPTSLDQAWTRLASRWDYSHWVSGPPALIVDYPRLRRLQSGQWTTVGNRQRLRCRVNASMDYHLRPHRLQSVQWTMRTNYL